MRTLFIFTIQGTHNVYKKKGEIVLKSRLLVRFELGA